MKKILISLAVATLIVPQIALASWWNPFSWKIFSRPAEVRVEQTHDVNFENKKATTTATSTVKIPQQKVVLKKENTNSVIISSKKEVIEVPKKEITPESQGAQKQSEEKTAQAPTVVAPMEWDSCKNIDGIQPTVPVSMYGDGNGNCLPITNNTQQTVNTTLNSYATPSDLCHNIAGNQVSMPDSMVMDTSGDCVVKQLIVVSPTEVLMDTLVNVTISSTERTAGFYLTGVVAEDKISYTFNGQTKEYVIQQADIKSGKGFNLSSILEPETDYSFYLKVTRGSTFANLAKTFKTQPGLRCEPNNGSVSMEGGILSGGCYNYNAYSMQLKKLKFFLSFVGPTHNVTCNLSSNNDRGLPFNTISTTDTSTNLYIYLDLQTDLLLNPYGGDSKKDWYTSLVMQCSGSGLQMLSFLGAE